MIHFDRIVLNLRSSGMTYQQIAWRVGVSRRAVESWAARTRSPIDYRIVLPLLNLHQDICPTRHRADVIGAP